MSTTVNLLCLPYAGGGASIYREWARALPRRTAVVPVHMPGRGARMHISPVYEWPALMELLIDEVAPLLDRPFALFGHSMGALVAFELAHAIRERFRVAPVWIGVSACIAPAMREWEDKWLNCPQDELIDEIRGLKGTDDTLLGNNEFMSLILPVLRADFHLCGTHRRHASRPPLACPMLALGGTKDEEVADDPRKLRAWEQETVGPFELVQLDGDHFFINTLRDEVLDVVSHSLARALDAPRQPAAVASSSRLLA